MFIAETSVFYPVSLRREGFCLPSTFDGFFRGTRCCNHALDLSWTWSRSISVA